MLKKLNSIFNNQKGEIVTTITLIGLGIALLGALAGSLVVQKGETNIATKGKAPADSLACSIAIDPAAATQGTKVAVDLAGFPTLKNADRIYAYYRKDETDNWKAIGASSTIILPQICGKEIPYEKCSVICNSTSCAGQLKWDTSYIVPGTYEVVATFSTKDQSADNILLCSGDGAKKKLTVNQLEVKVPPSWSKIKSKDIEGSIIGSVNHGPSWTEDELLENIFGKNYTVPNGRIPQTDIIKSILDKIDTNYDNYSVRLGTADRDIATEGGGRIKSGNLVWELVHKRDIALEAEGKIEGGSLVSQAADQSAGNVVMALQPPCTNIGFPVFWSELDCEAVKIYFQESEGSLPTNMAPYGLSDISFGLHLNHPVTKAPFISTISVKSGPLNQGAPMKIDYPESANEVLASNPSVLVWTSDMLAWQNMNTYERVVNASAVVYCAPSPTPTPTITPTATPTPTPSVTVTPTTTSTPTPTVTLTITPPSTPTPTPTVTITPTPTPTITVTPTVTVTPTPTTTITPTTTVTPTPTQLPPTCNYLSVISAAGAVVRGGNVTAGDVVEVEANVSYPEKIERVDFYYYLEPPAPSPTPDICSSATWKKIVSSRPTPAPPSFGVTWDTSVLRAAGKYKLAANVYYKSGGWCTGNTTNCGYKDPGRGYREADLCPCNWEITIVTATPTPTPTVTVTPTGTPTPTKPSGNTNQLDFRLDQGGNCWAAWASASCGLSNNNSSDGLPDGVRCDSSSGSVKLHNNTANQYGVTCQDNRCGWCSSDPDNNRIAKCEFFYTSWTGTLHSGECLNCTESGIFSCPFTTPGATLPPQCNWCTNYNYCVNVARCTWRNPQPSPAPCSVAGDGCCDCPGAAGKIIKIPPALMDVNKDGIIDSKDLLYCIRSQVKKGKGLVCDINQDGVVNALDYSLIRFNYTETAIR